MMTSRSLRIGLTAGLLGILTPGTITQAQQPTTNPAHKPGLEIPAPALLQPAELVQMWPGSEKPLVLQVGSHVLYAEAHIPNSEYVGAAGTTAGLEGLRQRVLRVRKDRTLVIYCGCCPWAAAQTYDRRMSSYRRWASRT